MFQVRTDLALEARELYKEKTKQEIPGVEVEREEEKNYTITRVKVIDKIGADSMGKPKGSYITIEAPALKKADQDLKDEISTVLAKELRAVADNHKHTKTLIV